MLRRKVREWSKLQEGFQNDGTLSACASMKVKECCEKFEYADFGCLSIAHDILRESTDFLKKRCNWWCSHPLIEWEVSLCRTCALTVIAFRWRTASGGSLLGMERSSVIGGVRRVPASMIGGPRTRFWSYKTARTTEKRKYFKHTLHRKECDNLVNVQKLLTNQQKDGDGPLENIVTGLLVQGRKCIMEAQEVRRSGQASRHKICKW